MEGLTLFFQEHAAFGDDYGDISVDVALAFRIVQ
jgi:hypothetical protein